MPLPIRRLAVEALEDLGRKALLTAMGPQMPPELFLVGESLAAFLAYLGLFLFAYFPPV